MVEQEVATVADSSRTGTATEKSETEEQVLRISAERGGREIIETMVFDAPRELVFRAYTDPVLVQRWWGPKELANTIEKFEPRTGGVWRIVQRDPKGNDYGFHGVFHEVVPNEKVVRTFEFEGVPGHVALESSMFEQAKGKTVVNSITVFQTPEDRDGMIGSDMERGVRESLERLLDLLDELQEASGEESPPKDAGT